MKIAFVGLGRMGKNMVLNLLDTGHKVVVYNRTLSRVAEMEKRGAIGAYSIAEAVRKLPTPKIIWLMVLAGNPVDEFIEQLVPLLKRGDIIIDGGNSFYADSVRRAKALRRRGIGFLDCGTSGGTEGARHGACMMIGGSRAAFRKTERLFKDMCVKDGYGYMGSSGAGHFVKMVHNGIEYGMMAALAEGMQAIDKHKKRFKTDLKEVARVYANGSIIEGRLAGWLLDSLEQRNYLARISGAVPKGETEEEMARLEKLADMPVLHLARMLRVRSRSRPTLAGRFTAALRNRFGGHKTLPK
ncbi:MAG: decarboxylating 6-phosphogluconate dehydrogenase [Planctomycetia bacterium]|nr:decarboxylating 6-phosphogluconate dehydrogenase [Planctomycetia bacterium]